MLRLSTTGKYVLPSLLSSFVGSTVGPRRLCLGRCRFVRHAPPTSLALVSGCALTHDCQFDHFDGPSLFCSPATATHPAVFSFSCRLASPSPHVVLGLLRPYRLTPLLSCALAGPRPWVGCALAGLPSALRLRPPLRSALLPAWAPRRRRRATWTSTGSWGQSRRRGPRRCTQGTGFSQ